MMRVTLGLAAASLLFCAAGPASAGFVGECKAFFPHAFSAPGGEQMKSGISKKYDDIADFCVCAGKSIQKKSEDDLADVTDMMKKVNDAYDDGASDEKAQAMMNNDPKAEMLFGATMQCAQ